MPKLKLVLVCSAFNVFAEMTVRGIFGLFQGLLPLFLFFHYVTYFYIIIHFIGKSRGYDMAVLAVGTAYAWFVMIFETGLAFVWGIASWLIFIPIIFIGEWGILQTLLPLYISKKYLKIKLTESRLSKIGWVCCIGYLIVFCVFSFPGAIKGALWLYLLSFITFGFNLIVAWKLIKKGEQIDLRDMNIDKSKNSNFLVIWFILTIVIGIFSGIITPFLFQPLTTRNGREVFYVQSFTIMTLWSLLSAIVILGWRYKKNRLLMPYEIKQKL